MSADTGRILRSEITDFGARPPPVATLTHEDAPPRRPGPRRRRAARSPRSRRPPAAAACDRPRNRRAQRAGHVRDRHDVRPGPPRLRGAPRHDRPALRPLDASLRPEVSTLTVLVNGVPRRSTRLTPQNAAAGRLLRQAGADPRPAWRLHARGPLRHAHLARRVRGPAQPARCGRACCLKPASTPTSSPSAAPSRARCRTSCRPRRTRPCGSRCPPTLGGQLAAAGTAAAALGAADALVNADPLIELGPASPSRPGLVIASGPAAASALRAFGLPRTRLRGRGDPRGQPRRRSPDARGGRRRAAACAAPPRRSPPRG